jgi:large subunit ribosomal protein L7Ae
MGKQPKGKKTTKTSKKTDKVKRNPLFESRPRNFRVGGDIRPKRDLTRFVRWPKYIILQRQKRILMQRLKVPPVINQFTKTIDKNQATTLLKLLRNYQPETKPKKKERLLAEAQTKVADKDKKKPVVLKYGLNHVTHLVEQKKARLVVIAHDVDPIETVLWLPQLCRKQEIPYCFIKGKARLGKLVNKKTATVVALTEVRKENQAELEGLAKSFLSNYNNNVDHRKTWGGGLLGLKATHQKDAKEKAIESEQIKKSGL